MTREEASKLNIFQIVRYNIKEEYCQDDDHKWLIPYCGKLGIITQKILWDDGGEEIHIRFPEKTFYHNEFYSSMEDLMIDFNNGHDMHFNEGFDCDAECLDLV